MRLAFRLLAKQPAFTAVAVLALALGIGPNTAIFSVVYANLLAPLPYPHPDRLVVIWSWVNGGRNQVSPLDFLDWKRQASSFQEMAAFVERPYNISSTQEPQYIDGLRVSVNWYKLVGEKVWMGRDFSFDEDQPGKDHVFILSHRCWASRFGSDPNIIGKQFQLNGEPYTVIGVMPPGTSDRHDEEIWVPLRFTQAELKRDNIFWSVIGRLKPAVSIQSAQQQMDAIVKRIAEQYPATHKDWGARVEPLKNDFQDSNTIRNLWLLLAAVSFVFLIACANVANLLLVRGVRRHRELAVRAALGASGGRLFWQMMVESLTLAGLGGILGVLLSAALLKTILLILPAGTLSPEADVRLSLPVLFFTLSTTIVSGVLFGCAPALQARVVDLNESLKQGGKSAIGSRHARLRKLLVVFEFALALTLLAAAALTVHSFVNRTRVALGIRTDHILTFFLPVPQSHQRTPEQTSGFYRDLLARLEAVPGVQSAAASTNTPLDDPNLEPPVSIVGKAVPELATAEIGFQAVTPDYFETLGVRVDLGRRIDLRDTANAPRVAIVNETFVHQFLNGTDPLSQRLKIVELEDGQLALRPGVERQIVGVFPDVQNSTRLGRPKLPEIWVPFAQSPWPETTVEVRTAIDPEKMLKAIANAIHSLDRHLPLANVKTMHQIVRDQFVEDRFGVALYGSLAAIGLLLALLGIYGLMSFAVAQTTAEIGLRIALGATAADVIRRVLMQGFGVAGAGLGLGFCGAYAASRVMQSSLYGTGIMDWSAFSAVAALLMVTALLACYIPARRASSVDPVVALRQE